MSHGREEVRTMSRRIAFLVVAGLALMVGAGAYASDQFSEDLVFSGEQMAELPVGAVVESSEPSFIEDQGYLAAIEAAAAAEWAMYESSAPDVSIAQSELSDMEPSALAGESLDFQPTPSSDQTLDLRAFLEKREAEVQAA
jgi:hypothetical protein